MQLHHHHEFVAEQFMTRCQNNSRWYIYAHKDLNGSVFYVGKGTGRRAWVDHKKREKTAGSARHASWYWYVERHLKNQYTVEILEEGLSEEEAFDAEIHWMGQYDPDTLINWDNHHGRYVGPTSEEYTEALDLSRETKQLCEDLRGYSTDEPLEIVEMLMQVLETVYDYAPVLNSLQRTGLVGQLQLEMYGERGMKGEIAVIERLSLWMKKAGQLQLAGSIVKEYFENFPSDLNYSDVVSIKKRLGQYWIDPDVSSPADGSERRG